MKRFRKEYIIIAIAVLMSVAVLAGTTYAVFTKTVTGDEKLTIQTGTLEITFGEGDEINLSNTAPMSDERGQRTTPYTFSVKNTGTITAYYTVYIEEDSGNTLDNKYVKYRLISDDGFDTGIVNLTGGGPDYVIRTEEALAVDKTVNYTLYMWLDEATPNEMQGTIYKSRVRVDGRSNPTPKLSGVDTLLAKANSSSITNYSNGNTGEMYTFTHDATSQQSGWTEEELTDYRYIGANPNNYATFSGSMWRIVGVFTAENDTGQKNQYIKLVKQDSIGTNTFGASTWGNTSLSTYLNSTYLNTLSDKSLISTAKWYISALTSLTGNGDSFYEMERSQPYTWTGQVGLLYPSDMLYTYGKGVSDDCYLIDTGYCNNPSSSWLYSIYTYHFFINTDYGNNSNGTMFSHYGVVTSVAKTSNYETRPAIYLNNDVSIESGTGTSSDPYIFSVESGPTCDPNGDGVVTQEDVTILSNAHLNGTTSSYYPQCDLNDDGTINMLDVMALSQQVAS